ncbi:hypothetical protein SDC9_190992 [bioreactor metagenome]|uniref:Uncharacterized protein n=1 Tax=bioreactor metagenome TaxID=1076179 RepID=A0A645HY52_9ZZZZ
MLPVDINQSIADELQRICINQRAVCAADVLSAL